MTGVKDDIRVFFRLIGKSLQTQMEYRLSFWMLFFSHLMVTGFEFFGIYALFDRFGSLGGWSLYEVCLLYGQINIAFGITELFSRQVQKLGDIIRSGELDRVLLRPRGNLLQLFAMEFHFTRTARIVQGAAVFVYGYVNLGLTSSPLMFGLLFWALIGSVMLFMGLMIIQGTLSFYTVQSLELMNTVTYGGVELAQYPFSIFKEWFQFFFIFIIPLGCVNYFPMILFMGKEDPLGFPQWFQALSPAMGVGFFLLSLMIWRRGLARYTSTGS